MCATTSQLTANVAEPPCASLVAADNSARHGLLEWARCGPSDDAFQPLWRRPGRIRHSAARDGVEQILGYMSPYDVSVRCTGSSSFQIETPLKLVRLSQIHIFVVIHA